MFVLCWSVCIYFFSIKNNDSDQVPPESVVRGHWHSSWWRCGGSILHHWPSHDSLISQVRRVLPRNWWPEGKNLRTVLWIIWLRSHAFIWWMTKNFMLIIFICYNFHLSKQRLGLSRNFFGGRGTVIPVNVCNEFPSILHIWNILPLTHCEEITFL